MKNSEETRTISKAVARIHANVLAFVFAVIGGCALFLMTAWLLIKGGDNIGFHLRLLNQYLIGYSVTWKGSIIGLFYGALTGGVVGWTIGFKYNRIIDIKQG